jgi:hypothetical protein
VHHRGVWWLFSTYGALFGSLRLEVFFGKGGRATFVSMAYLDPICIPRAVVFFQCRAGRLVFFRLLSTEIPLSLQHRR